MARRQRLLNTHTFDVTRASTEGATYQNGVYIEPADEFFPAVKGHVQPLSGKQMEKLPQYAVDKQTYQFFSQFFDFIAEDIITYKGRQYEGLREQDWDGFQMHCEHSFMIGVLVDTKVDM